MYMRLAILMKSEGFPNSEKRPGTVETILKSLDNMELDNFSEE